MLQVIIKLHLQMWPKPNHEYKTTQTDYNKYERRLWTPVNNIVLKLQRKKQTLIVRFPKRKQWPGMGCLSILNVFASPIIRSIWTHFDAVLRSLITSDSDSWFLPFIKDGILTCTSLLADSSWTTLRPRSAIMLSPDVNTGFLIKSDLSQLCLSLVEPPCASLT